jgi:hypothetical protein
MADDLKTFYQDYHTFNILSFNKLSMRTVYESQGGHMWAVHFKNFALLYSRVGAGAVARAAGAGAALKTFTRSRSRKKDAAPQHCMWV